MADQKWDLRFIFSLCFVGVGIALTLLFFLTGLSTYSHANTQYDTWDTLNITVSKVDFCGRGRCIENSYVYNEIQYFPRFLRCSDCQASRFCSIDQSVEILVDPSDPSESVIKQCAKEETTPSTITNLALFMAGITLVGVLIATSLYLKQKKD